MATETMIDTVLTHALAAWLWSETDHELVPLDEGYALDDIADSERTLWRDEVAEFCERAGALLKGLNPAQVGHDFTLTRNGHGAGFWDRGLGERGERLTELAREFLEVSAYVGDDGRIARI